MKKKFFILCLLVLNAFSFAIYPQTVLSLESKDYIEANKVIIDRMDSIKAKVDSVKAEILLVTKNTESEKIFGSDIDWYNFLFAFLAFIVACFSAVYDFRGFRESKRTADNVTRISFDVQIAQFDDLIRHLYRNLVCTMAITKNMLENKDHLKYPSEVHLLKLKVLPEDVLHLEKYNNNNIVYKMMHELKLLLRNYDVEIDTAMIHLKDGNIGIDVLRDDLDTLSFKPLYLTKKILDIIEKMLEEKVANPNIKPFKKAASIITKEHISKLRENKDAFKIYNYFDLTIADSENGIEKPYDGLRRSRNVLFNAVRGADTLNYSDIYEKDSIYHEYCIMMDNICKFDGKLDSLNDNITLGEFEFKKHFLTMLSIDATIEYEKIHMIKIVRHKDTDTIKQANAN